MSKTLVDDVVSAPSSQLSQWLSFQISNRHYAVPSSQVREVTREGELIPVPGAARELLGIRQLRGRIVPVVDGRLRLRLPAQLMTDAIRVRIVMLSWDEHVVGLRVDAVGALIDAEVEGDVASLVPVYEHAPNLVTGVLSWQGTSIEVLDIEVLFRLERSGGDVA